MTSPQPDDPPLTSAVCAAWAQMHELPNDVQQLHDEQVWCSILALASDILWSASGRRWRNVQASETVTLDPDGCPSWPTYALQYGYWTPITPDSRSRARVRLPRPDVTAIISVTLGGTAFTAFRRSGNYAVRTDGRGWPMRDTTRITYEFGKLVPHTGKLAVLALAAELGRAFAGKSCALPARVTSVVRQGISFDMLESLEVLKEGLTGLYSVDQWIRAINPNRSKQAGRVWSPDIAEARPV